MLKYKDREYIKEAEKTNGVFANSLHLLTLATVNTINTH